MSVKIERISEDAEDVVKNDVVKDDNTTDVEDEVEDEVNNDSVENVVKNDVDDVLNNISSKSVKQLSKSERSRLISDFENGTENPYFKVMRMKNGSIRVTKRREPLLDDASKANESANQRIERKLPNSSGKRLTNEQLLMEHIIDLETRYERMRMKHKKLKKRYNALENTIFEDDEDDVVEVVDDSVKEVVDDSVKNDVKEVFEEPVKENVKEVVEQRVEPTYIPRTRGRVKQHVNWREMIAYM